MARSTKFAIGYKSTNVRSGMIKFICHTLSYALLIARRADDLHPAGAAMVGPHLGGKRRGDGKLSSAKAGHQEIGPHWPLNPPPPWVPPGLARRMPWGRQTAHCQSGVLRQRPSLDPPPWVSLELAWQRPVCPRRCSQIFRTDLRCPQDRAPITPRATNCASSLPSAKAQGMCTNFLSSRLRRISNQWSPQRGGRALARRHGAEPHRLLLGARRAAPAC